MLFPLLASGAVAADEAPSPENDDFASAIALTGQEIRTSGTNTGAGIQDDEPVHAGNQGGTSVWWSWTASASGAVLIDTMVSRFDTLLAIYTGDSLATLQPVAANDDAGTRLSRVEFDAVAGTTYRIAVDGYEGASGDIGLRITSAVLRVPDDHDTIQGAIDAAEDGSTVLVRPGTRHETIDFRGSPEQPCKAIVVASTHGPYVTTIAAPVPGTGVVAMHYCPDTTTLSGFTITSPFEHGPEQPPPSSGGGIDVKFGADGGPVIHGNVIEGNQALAGAGVSVRWSSARVFDNRILHNRAWNSGSGLHLLNTPGARIIGNEFAGNHPAVLGVSGPEDVLPSALPLIANNWIHSNTYSAVQLSGPAVVYQNLIEGNTAGTAIESSIGNKQIIGNTIDHRDSSDHAVRVTLMPELIAGPSGEVAGNIIIPAPGRDAIYCSFGPHDVLEEIHHNVLGGSADPAPSCGAIAGETGNVIAEPALIDPESGDYRLQETSPAIDRVTVVSPAYGDADLDSGPRSVDGDMDGFAITDAGAYEHRAGGVIEFAQASYDVDPDARTVEVLIHRRGDATGEASARVATRDGTAVAGSGYEPTDRMVTFLDGESGTRSVRLDIPEGAPDFADEVFHLALSEPGGNASLNRLDKTSVRLLGDRADLAVTVADAPASAGFGDNLTVVFEVTNHGRLRADDVLLTTSYDLDVQHVTSSTGAGHCVFDQQQRESRCELGELQPAETVAVAVTLLTTEDGPLTADATVDSDIDEYVTENNQATATVEVSNLIRLSDYESIEPTSEVDTYLIDGTDIEVDSYSTSPAMINGRPAVKIAFAEGGVGFATLDDDGLRVHRLSERVPGIGHVKATFEPPLQVFPALIAVGESYHRSGDTVFTVSGVGTFRLGYESTSRVIGFEQVTVPLGTFNALKTEWTFSIAGRVRGQHIEVTATETTWFARDIGSVKTVTDADGEITVAERIGSTPTLTAPVPGATLQDHVNTFAWSLNGTPATHVRVHLGRAPGRSDFFYSGNLDPAVTEQTVSGLPMTGRAIHARLRFQLRGRWYQRDYQYTTAELPLPVLLSPDTGGFEASSARFRWTDNGHPVQAWRLYIGNRRGRRNYFDSGTLGPAELELAVATLPAFGETVHVRLRYKLFDTWHHLDHTFTAADLDAPALTAPAGPGLDASAATFRWSANGHAVDAWRLYVGNRRGQRNFFDSGTLGPAELERAVATLPAFGQTVHVRLRYRLFDTWHHLDHTFTAADLDAPALTAPAGPGLDASAATFRWSANGHAVDAWRLYVGNRRGQRNFFDSGTLGPAELERAVATLPAFGQTIHVRLRYRLLGTWKHIDYTFTAADFDAPALSAPAGPGLDASTATFRWSANGHAVDAWRLYVGNRRGRRNFFDSGTLGQGELQQTVTSLPAFGKTVHVRLRYRLLGTWKHIDYTFTAANLAAPELLIPVGPVVSGTHTRFEWTANGHAVEAWRLHVGKSRGKNHYHYSGTLPAGATETDFQGLPTEGETIHVRLRYRMFGTWRSLDYRFEAIEESIPSAAGFDVYIGSYLADPQSP